MRAEMLMTGRPRMLLVAGDPTGIGPEITAKLLAMPETRETASITLLGDPGRLRGRRECRGTPAVDF